MSGFLPASLAPMMVMTDDSASDRLFTASSVMAMEPETTPTTALKAAKNTFASMPMTLVRTMI